MQDFFENTSDAGLSGQLLIAMPTMSDPNFARTVIYMCAHSEDGAMGLIINRQAPDINFTDLLDKIFTPEGSTPITLANDDEDLPLFTLVDRWRQGGALCFIPQIITPKNTLFL